MRGRTFLPVVLLALIVAPLRPSAQGLQFALFERYLESLRVQAGIPGLSAAIVSNGDIVWEQGFGFADVEAAIRATPSTPYLIGDVTQTLGAVLALQCVEEADVALADPLRRWTSEIPDDATVRQILAHSSAAGAFRYDPTRFVALTPVISYCQDRGREAYPRVLTDRILDRAGMSESVPGHDIANVASVRQLFDSDDVARYDRVLARLATPYRVESGRPSRSEYPPRGLNAATGLISTVRDLANFDGALDDESLLRSNTRALAWSNHNGSPMGLGWFVQGYNGRRVVWHFGSVPNAYSSLLVKVPDASLSLILLANSDGLSAPFPLSNGDVTSSVFAQLFLRTFVS